MSDDCVTVSDFEGPPKKSRFDVDWDRTIARE